ncbi:MAG: acetylornithine deacetylase [Marinibacterium sp.]
MTRTLEILDRLVSFETDSSSPNLELISYVEDLLTVAGYRVHKLPDPSGAKAGLFASIGPDGDGVLLSAHSDVVPVAGQVWTRDPFRLTDGGDRVFGRGSTDMKGFLASMLAMAETAASRRLREPLKLSVSYDEEVGCVGMARMIQALPKALGNPRAAIVGEPTNMAIATGHKGKRSLTAICHGQAGHSSLAPDFVNALHLAADFIVCLRQMQTDLAQSGARDPAYDMPYSTVHVGRVSGGSTLNIVPDRADLALEIRHLPEDTPEALTDRLHRLAETVARPYRTTFGEARIEIRETGGYPGLDMAEDADVVAEMRTLLPGAGTTKVAFGTEAGFFDRIGIPTLVCGPGSMAGQGHKPDEYILKTELAACDALLSSLLDRMCAGG